jgi:hypothetical protein
MATFTTDAGTVVGDLVRLNAANTVTKITDNLASTIPTGVFGVCFSKTNATTCKVLFVGIVGGYAGLTAGSAVFVQTDGTMANAVPTAGIVQQIGFSVTSSEVFVNLKVAQELI